MEKFNKLLFWFKFSDSVSPNFKQCSIAATRNRYQQRHFVHFCSKSDNSQFLNVAVLCFKLTKQILAFCMCYSIFAVQSMRRTFTRDFSLQFGAPTLHQGTCRKNFNILWLTQFKQVINGENNVDICLEIYWHKSFYQCSKIYSFNV